MINCLVLEEGNLAQGVAFLHQRGRLDATLCERGYIFTDPNHIAYPGDVLAYDFERDKMTIRSNFYNFEGSVA